MQTRPAGQLGGKGEAGPHPPAVGDHREGAPSRAPSICKEPAGFGRQSFPLHSTYSSPSVAQRGSQELAFCSCGPSEVAARRLYPGGGHFGAPCQAKLFIFGHARPQACAPSGDKEEEEVREGEGYQRGTGEVCGLDEFDN